jgi:hypothetical protein
VRAYQVKKAESRWDTVEKIEADYFEIEDGCLIFYTEVDSSDLMKLGVEKVAAFASWSSVEVL